MGPPPLALCAQAASMPNPTTAAAAMIAPPKDRMPNSL